MEHIKELQPGASTYRPILQIKHEYLDLINPCPEVRFQFQRHLAMAESNRQPNESDLSERRMDYGLKAENSNISFNDWKKHADFFLTSYPCQGDTVSWRGVRLKTGDIFLCNGAHGSDGMFTTLVDGRQSFGHVAVYSLLQSEGQLFPAILEIHTQGIRAIPLKAYVSTQFNTYIEIYRSRLINELDRKKLAEVSLEMLNETHGFDIYSDNSQDKYLTCAQTVAQLYHRAGLQEVSGKSRYHLGTMPNLEILGVTSSSGRDLLMPDDYSRCPQLALVGVIDNGKFIELVARSLVRERMQKIWQTRVLNPSRFTVLFVLYWFVIQVIKLEIPGVSTFLAKKGGFTPGTFPSGPATFMALTPIVEAHIEHAAATLAKILRENEAALMKPTSWVEIVESDTINQLVTEAMLGFSSFFR